MGSASAGNIDVAVYDSALNRVVSAGSTAMSATVNTVQELNVTDTLLSPGQYLFGVACSSASGSVFLVSDVDEQVLSLMPVYEVTGLSSATWPATIAPVISTAATTRLAIAGMQLRSVY